MIKLFYTLLLVLILMLLPTTSKALPHRGFMLNPALNNPAQTEQEIDQLAGLKVNLVRLPIYFSVEPNVDTWLNFTEIVYQRCNLRRINLVIDFHHPSAGIQGSTIVDENKFVENWGKFAQRFANIPGRQISIWYDLCNEPNHAEWARVALRAAQEIRRYDLHTAIVYAAKGTTTSPASSSFRPLSGITNQIVEFHFWDWYSTVQSPSTNNYRYVGNAGSASSTNYTLAQLQAKLENVRVFGATYGVPVYIGEVGIYQGHRDAARFLRDFTNECDSKGIPLTVHAYREADVWNYEFNSDAWRILTAWLPRR
jgi:aryl-phospho-beta-D-glucosidase BglC (GH1 family)